MKKVLFIWTVIIISLLSVFAITAYADSPITSTQIYEAYEDNSMVQKALASHTMDMEIAKFLSSQDNPIDVKAAVINALGWSIEGKNNAEQYSEFLFQKPVKDLNQDELSGNDLFCIGYLTALDDYFHPENAIPVLEKAKSKLKDSFTVSIITAVVKSQEVLKNGKLYSIWKIIEQVKDNNVLKQDMMPEAVTIIVDYIQPYSRYFELDSGYITIKEGKSVVSNINGDSGPYKLTGTEVMEKDSEMLYMGAKINSNVFSADAKVDVVVSGNTISFKGVNAGTVMVSLANSNNYVINIPVIITKHSLPDGLNNAVALFVGSPNVLVNNTKSKIDSADCSIVPVIKDGRTLVPVRFISESFGANILWDNASSTTAIVFNGKTAKIKTGDKKIIIDGTEIPLDVPAQIINNRLYLPLRSLVENVLNKKVFFESGLIIISDNGNIVYKDTEAESIDRLIETFKNDAGNIEVDGGLRVNVHVTNKDGSQVSEKQIEHIKSIINRKLDNEGILIKNVAIDKGNITVEMPIIYSYQYLNNYDGLYKLLDAEKLTFQEVDEKLIDENGNYLPTNKIVLDNSDIKDANPEIYSQNGLIGVRLILNDNGAKKIAEATERLIGKPIAIFIGDKFLVAPHVNDTITNGIVSFMGQRNANEAGELADMIMLGTMNVNFEVEKFNPVKSGN